MPDANDHARVILAAIIPSRRDLLDKALRHLTPEHFLDPTLRNLFTLTERYAEVTGSIMTRPALEDMLRQSGADAGKQALYLETYDALAVRESDEADFRWSLQQIRELAAEKATGEAFAQAMEILRSGASDDRGQVLKGHEAARHHALEKFAEIDRGLSMQDSPEGDMTREAEDMLADYAHRKQLRYTGQNQGILLGIDEIDMRVGGFQPGELNLLAGYSSDGKTSLSVHLAHNASVHQGRNVVIFTTETLRPQVRRKLLSRHSVEPQFGIADGINSRWLKDGTLPENLEPKLQEVINDLTKNPNYGRLYIKQVPRGATIATVEAMAYRIQRMFNIELIIIDYLRLLRSERKRSSDREELGAIIVEGKQFATTFDDGRGVPVFSPWQVNRTARDQAERAGYYTSAALAETAEATNTADVIASILAPSDNEDRHCEVRAQILKNRDGETANSILLDVDYATSYFSSKRRASGMEHQLGISDEEPQAGDEFASLLG